MSGAEFPKKHRGPRRGSVRLMSTTGDGTNEDDRDDRDDAPVSWTRLEYDDGRVIRGLELTQQGATLYVRVEEVLVRTKQPERAAQIEIVTMKSAASAGRSFALRIENALKKEHVLCAPVLRPLPSTSTADERAAQREQKQAERLRRLRRSEDDTLAFFLAWHATGHDPGRSFRQEAQHRRQRDWNELAAACVGLCAETFGVVFSERIVVDEEHGSRGEIPFRHLADIYESPTALARLAIDSIDQGFRFVQAGYPSEIPEAVRSAAPNDAVSRALARFRARPSASRSP